MNLIKRVISLLIILLSISYIQAQIKVTGKIIDQANRPVSFAAISMRTNDSIFIQGVITDSIGCYSFNDIKKGKYVLSISCMGYQSENIQINVNRMPVTELSTIILAEESKLLNEVIVNGSSFIQKKDHLLVVPGKEQKKHAYTGYDLLYNLMIPDLTIDRRKNTVSSDRGAVTLYINGVEADVRDVQHLRPKDIERVEYYAVPSGIYVGDKGSVNYITKTPNSGGYISLDGEQTLGYLDGKYNVAAKLAQGNTQYMFFGGYSIIGHDGDDVSKSETMHFQDNDVLRQREKDNGKYRNNAQYAQFKVNNNRDNRNLQASFSYVRDHTPHNDRFEFLRYAGVELSDINSSVISSQKSHSPSLLLSGTFHPGKNQELYIRMSGSLSETDYDRLYAENGKESRTVVEENYYLLNAIIRYGVKFKHNNSFNVRLAHTHNITSTNYISDDVNWQHLWMGETHFYMNYSQYFKNGWSVYIDPGMSALNYRVHGDKSHCYVNFRGNCWFSYKFMKVHKIGFGFSVQSDVVKLEYLTPTDQTVDFLQVKRGNPNLSNPKYYNGSFTYNVSLKPATFRFKLDYYKVKHQFAPDYYIENNKLISSYNSNSDIDLLGTEIQITNRFSNKFSMMTKFRYDYTDINVKRKYAVLRNCYSASIDINYYNKYLLFNLYAKTPQQTVNETTYAYLRKPGSYGLIIRYSNNNFMCEIGIDSPFTKHNRYCENVDYGVYRYSQVSTNRINQQTAYLKLAYTFDFGKKTSREEKDINTQIDSAILKAE